MFSFILKCVQLQSYQNMSLFYHSHTKSNNQFLLIYAHQALLHTSHPLRFLGDYLRINTFELRFIVTISLILVKG